MSTYHTYKNSDDVNMSKKKLDTKNVAKIMKFINENYMLSIEDFKYGYIGNENDLFDTYCNLAFNIVYTSENKGFINNVTGDKNYSILVNLEFNGRLYEYFATFTEELEYDVIRVLEDESEVIDKNKVLNLFEAL